MTYDNCEGLVYHFDAEYSKPDPSVGFAGGWDIYTFQVEEHDENTDQYSMITDADRVNEFISKLTGCDYIKMESIAKGEREC